MVATISAVRDETADPVCLGLVLLEPDRPHNLGAALRLGACLAAEVHVVEPCGFPLDDRRIREAALDYAAQTRLIRHLTFGHFVRVAKAEGRRLILLTTRATWPHHRMEFRSGDLLLVGSESRGASAAVHEIADQRVRVPMRLSVRSLNVVSAAAVVLAEAMRQTGAFDRLEAGRHCAPDDEMVRD